MKKDKDGKSLGSELGLDIDLDIEQEIEKAAKRTAATRERDSIEPLREVSRAPRKDTRRSTFTDEDMREVVGRLLSDDSYAVKVEEDEPVEPAEEIKAEILPESISEIDLSGMTDDREYSDYINQVSEQAAREAARVRSSKERAEKRRAAREANAELKPIDRTDYEPDYSTVDEGGTTVFAGDAKYAVMVISFISLAILCFLVVKLRNTSAELKRLQASSVDVETNERYQALVIRVDGLEGENASLREENAALRNELYGTDSGDSTQVADNSEISDTSGITSETPAQSQTETPTQTEAPSESSAPRTYVAKRGDNYWKIAEMFYGDGSRYKEIMAANNVTNENDLQVDREIIIP